MITLKYQKVGSAVFISHIDVLRNMVRIMRRAKLDVSFSQGFNPHMLLFFSPPLALGISSVAEYVTADISGITAEEFVAAFNAAASEGFFGLRAYESVKSPNLAAAIVAADYEMPLPKEDAQRIVEFFDGRKEYVIRFTQKGKPVEKEVKSQILAVRADEKGLIFTLATGNSNLRADRLAAALSSDFGVDINQLNIVKMTQYVNMDGKLVDVDRVLEKVTAV